jgi:hypothetical protein
MSWISSIAMILVVTTMLLGFTTDLGLVVALSDIGERSPVYVVCSVGAFSSGSPTCIA